MTPTTTLTSKLTVSFVAAFVATTIALVYVLRAPHIIIQDAALADEYYYVNAGTTLGGDLFAGALLLMAAQYVIYLTNVTGSSRAYRSRQRCGRDSDYYETCLRE